MGSATFSGTVGIDVTVHETVEQIVLNAAELAISDVEVRTASGEVIGCTVSFADELEQVIFHPSSALAPGPSTLTCRFTGTLNDKLRGFYRSTFTDDAGATHTIATTQFESVDARRAFPCWDEPDRKAVFEVTLTIDRDVDAFSNSPIVDVRRVGDKNVVRFSPTMKMSTYLVAFIVGQLETTATIDVDGVPLRVVFTPGKRQLADFALAIGSFAIRFFSEYFDIPYPGEKVDLVAIPDFAAGAMENLGCITFRDTALLIDPSSAARAELERVADVVAHELAHMWFGDLVTMGWWEGIWLNEAFATFMETLCVDAFRPSWDRWVGFAPSREAALGVDALHLTRPIEYPVGPPKEAEGMFDVLTYQKGGSVLRMLEQFLGADVFREGIHDYLTTHSYGNTETSDLWDALERSSGRAVRTIMDTWINQGGYPLVRVDEDGSLSQSPFSYSGEPGGAIGSRWQVPVLTRSLGDAEPDPRPLLLRREHQAADAGGGAAGLVVNAGGSGYYRVSYPTAMVQRLAARMVDLAPLERYNLVSDTWAASLSGQAPLSDVLALARALIDSAEGDPSVWSVLLGALGLFDRVIPDGDRPVLAAAVRALLGPLARDLGWDPRPDDSERTPSLRSSVLRALGTIGDDADTIAEAARRFAAQGTVALDADTESAILDIVATNGGVSEYEAFVARYRAPANPQEENRYLYALASFTDPGLVARTFDLAVSEVRTQSAPLLVLSLVANRVNGPVAWRRTTEEWDALVEKFPANILPRMLDGIRGLCSPPELAEQVTAFVRAHPLPAAGRSVDQSLERLAVNVAFGQREAGQLAGTLTGALGLSR